MTKPDPQRLSILTELRRDAGLNLTQMARRCGLRGKQSHQTAGAWEHGVYVPSARRRPQMIGYLWDDLRLRTDPEKFETVWAILEEVWGWESIGDEEWAAFTTLPRPGLSVKEPARAPYQAPAAPASFVGRTNEMNALEQLLTGSLSAPVALVGMGGIGKSTIAARIAAEVYAHFADGVLWANARVSEPLDVLSSWAKAYDHDFSGLADVQSRASAMRNLLADKQTLIVLDDVSSPSRVAPLLPGHSGCVILLTTRSEDVASALAAKVLRLPELSLHASLDLLARFIGQARIDAEGDDAASICTQLHNLPLAVEIAGQLLAARPRRRLTAMVANLRVAQARLDLSIADRDVRTSFLVSWDALDEVHREAFTHTAVFEGRSFTAARLAGVLGTSPLHADDRLEMLAARSLVTLIGEDRYRQHPLLVDFAGEQLGEERATWIRFTTSMLEFVHVATDDPTQLEPEWGNVMAGMRTASEYEMWSTVLEYAEALTEPWFTTGRYDQARQGYAYAVDAAKAIGDDDALAFSLCKWGRAYFEQDEYAQAERLCLEVQQMKRTAARDVVHAESSFWIGRIALERGKYDRAERFLHDSETIYRTVEEPNGLAFVFYQQAQLAYDRGNLDATEALCQQALAIQDEERDQTIPMAVLRLLADVDIEAGDYEAAATHCQQALDLGLRLQSRAELAATYYSLAVIARLQDELQTAATYAAQSWELCEMLGMRAFEALVIYEQSRVCVLQNEHKRAYDLCSQSISLFRELGRTFNLVYALNHLGQICYERKQFDVARRQWQDALALAEHLEHPLVEEINARLAQMSV